MQSRFLIFALLSAVTFFATDSLAQQPGCPGVESVAREHFDADDYAELQQNASEQLQIKVIRVVIRRSSRQNSYSPKYLPGLPPVLKLDVVEIEAQVTEVKKSKSGLKNESFIKIYYITNQNFVAGNLKNWEAISPMLMEVNKTYTVFLKNEQIKDGSFDDNGDNGYRYVPVAYSKSFEQVKEIQTNSVVGK